MTDEQRDSWALVSRMGLEEVAKVAQELIDAHHSGDRTETLVRMGQLKFALQEARKA